MKTKEIERLETIIRHAKRIRSIAASPFPDHIERAQQHERDREIERMERELQKLSTHNSGEKKEGV